jgi:CTP:molybdopterin cytidylyltransferase MocA
VRRAAWPFAANIEGDRGLGPLLAGHPELVLEVPVAGAIPDIDTPADLAAAAGGGGR